MKKDTYVVTVKLTVKARNIDEAADIASAVVNYGAVETAHNIPPSGFKAWCLGAVEEEIEKKGK